MVNLLNVIPQTYILLRNCRVDYRRGAFFRPFSLAPLRTTHDRFRITWLSSIYISERGFWRIRPAWISLWHF